MPTHRICIGIVVGSVIATTSPSLAQTTTASVVMGQNLAKTFCRDYHQIGIEGSKPRADVPSFLEIANLRSTTDMSIRTFLQIEHSKMPNYQLTPDQTENVMAFIMSLQK
jgi:mono/diheme cytochrome c family protein